MEEEADITAARNGRIIVTGASHRGAKPCVTFLIDAYSHAVLGTVVTGAGTPKDFPPA